MNFTNLKTKKRSVIGTTLIVCILVLIYSIYQNNKNNSNDVEVEKITEAIKQVEATYPARIGKTPTEAEIYSSPHIKRIRLALDSYLNGSNDGVEEDALDKNFSSGSLLCGLDRFDKSYYSSKFVILSASDNDYGGVQAYIIFIDKPDKIFWVWVYNDSSLRTICEDTEKINLIDDVKVMIKEGKYSNTF
jgi:hypothetical protein